MVDWYLVSVLIFAAIVAVLVCLDRKNWKRESILLLRKTQIGKRFLIKLGTRFPRFWLVIGAMAVIATLYSSLWIIWLLLVQTQLLATGQMQTGPGILLPSPTSQASMGPGFFAVPFWYWIISIAILVIVHEGMHGVMAAREKVRIKSLGWGLLAVIPLAFVEPDEKQLQKQKPMKQLRVFAAGSFANFVVAFVSVLLLASAASAWFMPAGVSYQGLIQGYPAANVNLTGTITGIDNYTIDSTGTLSTVLREIGPNQTITVTTTNGTENLSYALVTAAEPEPDFRPDFWTGTLASFEQVLPGTVDFSKSVSNVFAYVTGSYQPPTWVSLEKDIKFWQYVQEKYPNSAERDSQRIASLEKQLETHPRSGFIGIAGVSNYTIIRPGFENYQEATTFIEGLLFFLFLINLGVGTFNMLPIGPLDGGRMWAIIFQRLTPRHSKAIMSILTWIMLAIIIANFALVLL
jgi:membrane-associated protease RseP (regulator of RpoE activity)